MIYSISRKLPSIKRPADKGKKNKPWLIESRDADGNRAYAKGFTDKGLTEQLASGLENEVMLRRRGMLVVEAACSKH